MENIPTPPEQGGHKPLTISFPLALSVYAIGPPAILFAIFDTVFGHGLLRSLLPHSPEDFLWWTVILSLPHIMASFFSFADPVYISYYKRQLLIGLPLLLGGTILLSVFAPPLVILFAVTYLMYHLVSQQGGVIFGFSRGKPPLYSAWRWTIVIFGALLFLITYFPENIPAVLTENGHGSWIIAAGIAISVLFSLYILNKIKTKEGRLYFSATAASLIFIPLFFWWGYPMLAVIVLRVIHDGTAFIFYIVHDNNRNSDQAQSLVYRFLPKNIPLVVWTPVLAIALALPFSFYASTITAFLVTVTHYYTEGFVWKRGTPHRAQVSFSTS